MGLGLHGFCWAGIDQGQSPLHKEKNLQQIQDDHGNPHDICIISVIFIGQIISNPGSGLIPGGESWVDEEVKYDDFPSPVSIIDQEQSLPIRSYKNAIGKSPHYSVITFL